MGIHTSVDPETGAVRFLSPEGALCRPIPSSLSDELLVTLYRAMTRTRIFDGKAVALQRTGQLGTFASALGQEAVGVGAAAAMQAHDVLAPSYRDHGAQFLRGMTMAECLLYWGGDERGSDFAGPRLDFPNCVPVATQIAHAVGASYAFRLQRADRVVVTFIGDGGTANGGFYEALNMAGVWRTPTVIIINNNGWAISTPCALECAAPTLAQKGVAVGIEGWQIDGNDVVAVYDTVRQAVEKARAGQGPTLIEALTYRLGDHTTADDATRYRDPELVRREWAREPIARLRAYLLRKGAWNQEKEDALQRESLEEVGQAVNAYLATHSAGCDAMFDHLYATLPASYVSQRDTARRFEPKGGGGHG
ncbi:pyruvate dehydrogenase (acetyl-transferring) E1 component subunit alpha [Methylocystis sp. MJC1]|uniref:pyruvate dehydrogenase (acetyl-transferring) E1 component subunit alpha n=1 Tax=Methylocystis sp. MJC1 TaxID=2654282 RepID=UPI0013EDEB74|nr:pyruvate dehydrogenase (acetyl-transferring) E1 component subunit alpha [Methylocystis sp. MJC1]KAF2989836.1 3-methyl-2-oxobutanoate dehydrogenase subunit alpha [Methylocystis sp. MJC1]MBU6528397.1 pyruvate dehydrogenase (acetyl-transferring) E1 component subunit alpha [Methylocystis sp. MJC1]UZX11298.1 pyruvate dehydrogenase (acetyl-transferring) E1 component subunit alpha [Methylocystis sp. MJC1]